MVAALCPSPCYAACFHHQPAALAVLVMRFQLVLAVEQVQISFESWYVRCALSFCCCSDWLAEDKAKAIAEEKRRIEEEEANMLVGPELPAGVSQADMGDYGGALLPGEPHSSQYIRLTAIPHS